MHPDGKAHGRTALIIRNDIKHYGISKFQKEFLQTTSIAAKDQNGCIIISAIYSPLKHIIKKEQYIAFFKMVIALSPQETITSNTYIGDRY